MTQLRLKRFKGVKETSTCQSWIQHLINGGLKCHTAHSKMSSCAPLPPPPPPPDTPFLLCFHTLAVAWFQLHGFRAVMVPKDTDLGPGLGPTNTEEPPKNTLQMSFYHRLCF